MNSLKTHTHSFLFYLVFVATLFSGSLQENRVILESPTVNDRGNWGDLVSCLGPTEIVVGFQLRVDYRDPFNEDNTGVDGIWLACGDLNWNEYTEDKLSQHVKWISSSLGPNGTYGQFQRKLFCSNDGSHTIGFQLKSQKNQGALEDHVGVVNLKMICADGEVIEGYDEKENLHPDANYTNAVICPKDFGVCGIQTREEEFNWKGDNTGVNNIRIECCPVPKQEVNTTTTEATDDEDAGVAIVSGQDEGPLPSLVRLFEKQEGIGTNETITISSHQCNSVPENWIGRIGSLEYNADCIRIWETSGCSGNTRCHCDEGFISFDKTLPVSNHVSSWQGKVNGLSICRVENDNFTSFRMFSEKKFKGESEYMILEPEQCMGFFEGDKWRGRVVSMTIVDGCVEFYGNEECSGKPRNTALANDYDATAEISSYETVRALRNCATNGQSSGSY